MLSKKEPSMGTPIDGTFFASNIGHTINYSSTTQLAHIKA